MEERKRPASNEDGDNAPPLKRQATSKDSKSTKGQDADMPGRDDLERFKKEAIYRQMLEYKREKQTLESRLAEANKSAQYHDEHIRTLDAWIEQLIDEVRLLFKSGLPSKSYDPFPTQLLASDVPVFQEHLSSRGESVSSTIKSLLAQENVSQSEASALQEQIAKLLASEKDHVNQVEKVTMERDQLLQRLETATSRYIMAEKKLDRAKSATVAKLEQQAISGARPDLSSPVEGNSTVEHVNGSSVDGEAFAKVEEARRQAEAASFKQKQQVEHLASENEKLTVQLTASLQKQTTLTDDDYASTDLFKHLKHKYEEVIRRVNDLEATNIELRKEAERLQAERTAYKSQLDSEQQGALSDKDVQLTKLEQDLIRIRSARDDLYNKCQLFETGEEQERASIGQLKNLIAAKDERIQALESQIERQTLSEVNTGAEGLSEEELRKKYASIQQQYDMLMQELQSTGTAYKKLQASTHTKIASQVEVEERIKRVTAEKVKADQKYFAAMKAKDALKMEISGLRAQATKSSDLISQMREAEQTSKNLVLALENEAAKTKELLEQLTKQGNRAQADLISQTNSLTSVRGQLDSLREQLDSKDTTIAEIRSTKRKAEVEIEELKVSVQERDKRIDASRKGKSGASDSQTELLWTLAWCTVCRKNPKNTVIKTCGHTMCNLCVEERITSRSRKCPHCNKAFGRDDYMKITLN